MDAEPVEEEQFGPYTVYERLGVGGMATVHRALERGIEGFERMVALKRLLPHLAEDASFIKSFVREAKLASILNHINIVQIYELGRVGTQYFISMEYIEGRDVRRVLRHARKVTGPAAIHVTVGILLQLCEALDYAHNRKDEAGQPLKLVHRDISPSNLLITSAGHLKVIDFGIARAQSNQLRTQTGRVKGKLAYMAPEALSSGKELDARSDLWAVGVIAHELLTARPLFASKNEYQTLLKVQRGDIMPPSTFNQACPPELDAVVLGALARDPEQRFASAADMRDALLEIRRIYQLQTDYRDIAGWLDWAFAVEAPSGGFAGNTLERSGSGGVAVDFQKVARTPLPGAPAGPMAGSPSAAMRAAAIGRVTPLPSAMTNAAKRDEDEAVDIAWGGADPEDNAGPVLLEDIPDVSERMSNPSMSADDIPVSQPSHGTLRTGPIAARESIPSIANMGTTGRARSASQTGQTGRVAARPTPLALGATGDLPTGDPGTGPAPRPSLTMSVPTIGSNIAARGRSGGAWKLAAGLVVVGAIGGGAVLITRKGDDPAAKAQGGSATVKKTSTLKFNVQPADSTISIQDMPKHEGSPWSIELAPGSHSVTIEHAGFKPYLVAVDLEADDKQTLRVVLEPLDANANGDATLILNSTPDGLDVVIDGKPTGQRTPARAPLPAGAHQIALRRDGVEVWHTSLVAKANTMSEITAAIAKPAPRVATGDAPAPARPAGTSTSERVAAREADKREADKRDDAKPAEPEPVEPAKPEPAKPEPAKPEPTKVEPEPKGSAVAPVAPTPVTPTPAVAKATGPITIAPTKVSRVSGDVPKLTAVGRTLPPMLVAKLCIDTAGKVTSTSVLTKLDATTIAELTDAMSRWRYTPYKDGATAQAACFAVTMKTK